MEGEDVSSRIQMRSLHVPLHNKKFNLYIYKNVCDGDVLRDTKTYVINNNNNTNMP
jgi:hypothetical protein